MATLPVIAPAGEVRPPPSRSRWQAHHAWACAIVLIVVAYFVNEVFWSLSRASAESAIWQTSPWGIIELHVFQAVWWVLAVLLFASSRSVPVLLDGLGLRLPPTLLGWVAAWLGVGIGWLVLYPSMKGWIAVDQSNQGYSFRRAGGGLWWAYAACLVILTPLFEETAMRGFLYRAFRGTYSRAVSTFLVLCIVAYFHLGLVAQPHGFVSVIIGGIVLCFIRESTGSLWNCILFHAAYNATVTLPWQFSVVGMLAALPVCARTGRYPLSKFIDDSLENRV